MNKSVWHRYNISSLPKYYTNALRAKLVECLESIILEENFSIAYHHKSIRIIDYLQAIGYKCDSYETHAIIVLSLVDMYFSQSVTSPSSWIDILFSKTDFRGGIYELADRRVEILHLLRFDLFHYTYYDHVWDILQPITGIDKYSYDINELARFYSKYLLYFRGVQFRNIERVAYLIVGLASADIGMISSSFNRYIVRQILKIRPGDYTDCPLLLEDNLHWIKQLHTQNRMVCVSQDDLLSEKDISIVAEVPEIEKNNITFGSCLGKGSFGLVVAGSYRGIDVAIKTSKDVFGAENNSFLCELVALNKIRSEYVIRLNSYYLTGSRHFNIVLERGQMSLVDWISDDPDPEMKLSLINGLLRGVYDIHKLGFVHRDLKPANVLVSNNVPKICDFGMAMQIDQYEVCDDRNMFGTNNFYPPEGLLKLSFISKSMDIWALGCTIYSVIVGEYMFNWYEDVNVCLRNIFSVFGNEIIKDWFPRIMNTGLNLRMIASNPEPLENVRKFLNEKRMGLFLRMFEYDPVARITIEELCREWLD
jgi:hypothetical protein